MDFFLLILNNKNASSRCVRRRVEHAHRKEQHVGSTMDVSYRTARFEIEQLNRDSSLVDD